MEFEEKVVEKYKKNNECSNRDIEDEVISWLAANINKRREAKSATVEEVEDMLQNQIAVLYLLVWPIMEQQQFSGFLRLGQIKEAAERLSVHYNEELKISLEHIIRRFFDRYQIINDSKNQLYKGLGTNSHIDEILKKKRFENLDSREKIHLLLYVIYRYRNNIFHGEKNIASWTKYENQIKDCLVGMMTLTDCMKEHKIIIENQGGYGKTRKHKTNRKCGVF